MSKINILIRYGFIEIPLANGEQVSPEAVATIIMNFSYYGFSLSASAYGSLCAMSSNQVAEWWKSVETELKSITGDDRNIGDFVVYKNFPAEVLSKSEAEYWIPQILMYWGFPKELFTQPIEERASMKEKPKLKVLHKSKKDTLSSILESNLRSPARWKDEEFQVVAFLIDHTPVNLAKMVFKENMVRLAVHMMESGKKIPFNTATDILRLIAGLSDGDISLRTKFKFKSLRKPMRRMILESLEECAKGEDIARRPEMWKRAFHNLHPWDYAAKLPRVCAIADHLYKGELETENAVVERAILKKNPVALDLLSLRPGDFRRRLVHMLDLFGKDAVTAFTEKKVLNGLTTNQIVSLRCFLDTANDRVTRAFPPKGNWNKLQIGAPRPIKASHVKKLSKALGAVLAERIPPVKVLDDNTIKIKLPNNGEVGPFTRGTSFPIPKGMEFIRTASYWKQEPGKGVTWFDNGWNFFDTNWQSKGACCWNATNFMSGAAIFSGDPVNTGEMKGRAAQMIDLYPAKLRAVGIRYAVWNILCFSRVAFGDAEDVFAALQWGKDAQSGKLFEPSRCQLAFPLSGKNMTKYVCLIDLETNEMVYLDANLHGDVSSAARNGDSLQKNMPAFMEYIASLPSVYDLFFESADAKNGIHVLYSDKDVKLDGESAYVFKTENKDNKFKPVAINNLLG